MGRRDPRASGALEPDPSRSSCSWRSMRLATGSSVPSGCETSELAAAAPGLDWDKVRRIARRAHVEKAVVRPCGGALVANGSPCWTASSVGRSGTGRMWRAGTSSLIARAIGSAKPSAWPGTGTDGGRAPAGSSSSAACRCTWPPASSTRSDSLGRDGGPGARAARRIRSDPLIVEIGTGCGAVSILACRSWPGARIYATDVSARAVACARQNANRLGAAIDPLRAGEHASAFASCSSSAGRISCSATCPYVSPIGGKDLKDWSVPEETVYGPDPDGLGLMRMLATAIHVAPSSGGILGLPAR